MKKIQTAALFKALFSLIFLCYFTSFTTAQDHENEEIVYSLVEQMPSFKGCENEVNENARSTCSNQRIMAYINELIKYPNKAKDAGVEGIVYVSYVVDANGKVGQVEIERSVEGAELLNEEAMRIVRTLPDFNPGMQKGQAVSVRFIIPVNFKLG